MTAEQDREQIVNGASDWRQRLQEKMELVSPGGTVFNAYWIGSPRTKEKKLGVFDFPIVDGTVVQDLGTKGSRYSLNFFFEGPDNDITAQAFYNAIDERGLWAIEHPVHGFLGLQPQTITTIDNPTESGNVTEIQSEWIEPIDEFTLLTARQLFGVVEEIQAQYDAISAQQFNNETSEDTFSETAATGNAIDQATTSAVGELGDLAAGNDEVAARVTAAQAEISTNLAQEEIVVADLVGPTQAIIQAPALGSSDTTERLDAYDNLADALIERLPSSRTTSEAKNQTVAIELSLGSVISGSATSVITGALKTRAQAMETAGKVVALLDKITSALDSVQDDFEIVPIDSQYFSQSESYTQAVELVGKTIEYLILASFDLRVERRFTLSEPTVPLMIVLEQYGSDDRFGEFIEANELKNNDINLLEPGREVVLYG
jgi:prophage DNA circulation protein